MQLIREIKSVRNVGALLVLTVLFTALNAFKPLAIDDTLYSFRAHQVAVHPLDPYGFKVFWNDRPEPAIQVLAPPLFPYYWAIAIRLFGERPVLWKLFLFPLAALLVFSLNALLRRFAAGHDLWLTWFVIFSPVFLPGFNLMLEVPVAALCLLALNLFLRACDRDSLPLAILAGIINGLGLETKYTAFITVGVVLLYALLFKRLRLGVVTAALAGLVFALFEGLTVWRYGHSHFLYQSSFYGSVNFVKKYVYLSGPLVTLMGSLAPALALLAAAALQVRRRIVLTAAAVMVLGYVLLALLPQRYQFLGTADESAFAHVIFSILGVAVYGILVVVIWRLCRLSLDWRNQWSRWREHRIEWFLSLWWLMEIAGYFALSPIPAARRLPGLLIVSTLLLGRLATQTCGSTQNRRIIKGVVVGSMALGLLFYVVDFKDAVTEKVAAEGSAQRIAVLPDARGVQDVWYLGRWGFQYYAERAGMNPVIADESKLQEGDWLVIPDGSYYPRPVAEHLSRYKMELVDQFEIGDWLPLRTMMGYYNSGIPLSHHEGPRRTVRIYRIISGLAR